MHDTKNIYIEHANIKLVLIWIRYKILKQEITIGYSHIGCRIYRIFWIAVFLVRDVFSTRRQRHCWCQHGPWTLAQTKTASKTVVSKQCYKQLCHKVITESSLTRLLLSQERWLGLDSAPCSLSWSLPRICSQTQLGHHLSKAHCGQDFEPLHYSQYAALKHLDLFGRSCSCCLPGEICGCIPQGMKINLTPKWLRLRSSPSGQSVPLICVNESIDRTDSNVT